ncbi:MAG TPA: amidohydrolase [Bacteroidota bacterium]|nr:amidohydrolase [Bacteroidota bacterium]
MDKKLIAAVFVVLLAVFAYVWLDHPVVEEADMLLINGVVYTLNDAQPIAQAVAVRAGKIAAVGGTDELRERFSAAQVIDLKGKPVYPGFTDAHAHLEGLGALLLNINLMDTRSVAEIQELVAERAAVVPPGTWIRGRAWDQNRWPIKTFPTHDMLDSVTTSHPVYLKRVDGHAAWVNKEALDLAGITRDTPDPEGGKILRDARGEPTGVLIDNAVELVEAVMPPPSEAEMREAIEKAARECVRVGLTEVHDMGVELDVISIYKTLINERKLPLRLYVALAGAGPAWRQYAERGPEVPSDDPRLTIRALKVYADGALGSRGAALIEPYSDDPTNRGLTLTSADSLRKLAEAALRSGFQLCVHAIGDRANHIVLNVFEDIARRDPSRFAAARFRIEHVQVLEPNDIPRFKRNGVIPSMQPTHCTSDMPWAEERLGPERVKGAYAWRSLLETGASIAGGSDFPVESPNPLYGFYAAITRQDHNGMPPEGWYPEQRMQRFEALKAFTIWPAYAAFEESIRGSIEEGKLADIVVLSNDIMKCDPREILGTTVVYTIVGGEIVYAADTHLP